MQIWNFEKRKTVFKIDLRWVASLLCGEVGPLKMLLWVFLSSPPLFPPFFPSYLLTYLIPWVPKWLNKAGNWRKKKKAGIYYCVLRTLLLRAERSSSLRLSSEMDRTHRKGVASRGLPLTTNFLLVIQMSLLILNVRSLEIESQHWPIFSWKSGSKGKLECINHKWVN